MAANAAASIFMAEAEKLPLLQEDRLLAGAATCSAKSYIVVARVLRKRTSWPGSRPTPAPQAGQGKRRGEEGGGEGLQY